MTEAVATTDPGAPIESAALPPTLMDDQDTLVGISIDAHPKREPVSLERVPKGEKTSVMSLPLDVIDTGENVRKHFDEAAISELADSIHAVGLISPIVVAETDTPGRYRLVAGERRFRAARKLEKKHGSEYASIRAIVQGKAYAPVHQKAVQLLENTEREDLSATEMADAVYELAHSAGFTPEAPKKDQTQIVGEVASLLGWPKRKVRQSLALATAPEVLRLAGGTIAYVNEEGRLVDEHHRPAAAHPGLSATHLRVLVDFSGWLKDLATARKKKTPKARPLPTDAILERVSVRCIVLGLSKARLEELLVTTKQRLEGGGKAKAPRAPKPLSPDEAERIVEKLIERLDGSDVSLKLKVLERLGDALRP